jgi:hypothetical protein
MSGTMSLWEMRTRILHLMKIIHRYKYRGSSLNTPDIPLAESAAHTKTDNKSISGDTQIHYNSEHEFQILFDGPIESFDVTLEPGGENRGNGDKQ